MAKKVQVNGSLPALSPGTAEIGTLGAGTKTIGYVGVTGSPEILRVETHDVATALAAAGSEHVHIVSSPGYMGRLDFMGIYIPAVDGASSGTHRLYIAFGGGATALRIVEVTAAYNKSIQVTNGCVTGTVTFNLVNADQAAYLLKGLHFDETEANGLYIYYANNTDVAQAGTRQYRVNYIEWPVA